MSSSKKPGPRFIKNFIHYGIRVLPKIHPSVSHSCHGPLPSELAELPYPKGDLLFGCPVQVHSCMGSQGWREARTCLFYIPNHKEYFPPILDRKDLNLQEILVLEIVRQSNLSIVFLWEEGKWNFGEHMGL